MWLKILRLVAPFSAIARELSIMNGELKILRELRELELSSRTPPIIRITENPGRSDTEVTYMGDEPPKKNIKERLATLFGEPDDDYAESDSDQPQE